MLDALCTAAPDTDSGMVAREISVGWADTACGEGSSSPAGATTCKCNADYYSVDGNGPCNGTCAHCAVLYRRCHRITYFLCACCGCPFAKCTACTPNSFTLITGSIGPESCLCKLGYEGVDGGPCEGTNVLPLEVQ